MSKKRTGTNFDDRNLPDLRTIEGMMNPVFGEVVGEALDKAQELIYQAWESPDPAERVDPAKRALQMSADCADTWVLLGSAGNTALYACQRGFGPLPVGRGRTEIGDGASSAHAETEPQ